MKFSIPVEELRFYDVISQSLMVEEGCYIIGAGTSSANILIKTEIQIPGKKQGNVIPFLNELDRDTAKIGAVNVIKIIRQPKGKVKQIGRASCRERG